MSIKLEDLPNKKSREFPEQITVKLTAAAKRKLDELERMGKDPSGIVRQALDRHLGEVKELKELDAAV